MRKVLKLGGLAALLLAWGFPARGDDTDIFLVDAVEPNVVILLDSSGSMDDPPTVPNGNATGWGGGSSATNAGPKKIEIAKDVVTNLIANVQGVRIGIFRFNDAATSGQMVAPVGTDPQEMIDLVNAISPTGLTPLGRATQTVQDYYLGEYSQLSLTAPSGGSSGGARWGSGGSFGWGWGGGGDDDDDGWGGGDDDDSWGGGWGDDDDMEPVPTTYPSPIQYTCQKNYVIVVTDGLPNGEDEDLVTQVAGSLFDSDHSDDLDGKQNVIVYTVGFDVPAGAELLTEAAAAGGGSFYTASNTAELESALLAAISQVLSDAYNFAAPVIPSASVTGGSLGYIAAFEPDPLAAFWPGQLRAYTRGSDGKIPTTADGEPDPDALAWGAGALLATQTAASRTIYTSVAGARQSFVKTNAALTAALLGVGTDTMKDQVIDFIRGTDAFDVDADGDSTELRPWKLGDIVHSVPVLVYPPPLASPDADYAAFKSTYASRPAVLLVGANDGMLHAFRAADGVELWGFIPADMLADLQSLTPKIGAHFYYVDGTPVVADVKTGGSWKTMAIFGERRGGRSYHALNISDTTNPGYLWSFTDAEMGESWSTPQVGKIKLDGGTAKWVAFVGGGYDTASNNASGRAFFVIDLETGAKLWEYKVGVSDDHAYMNFSLAAEPAAVDLDRDGYIDRVYAGDVGGQLWKFDVSAAATVEGGLVTNWTGKRLFAAAPSQANPPAAGEYVAPAAFYGSPKLAFNEEGDLWVFVGTGDRNHPKSGSANRFYGILDNTTMANDSVLTESSLVAVSGEATVSQGWYYTLGTNEKVLARADVFDNTVYFTAYTPESTEICNAALGSSKLYAIRLGDGLPALDWGTGESLQTPGSDDSPSIDAGDGIASEPEIVLGTATDTVVVGSSDGELTEVEIPADRTKRIQYWREVF